MAPIRANELRFVPGIYNAEDLVRVPGTRWLIGSGMIGPGHPQGHLYLIDAEAKIAEELFPGSVEIRPAQEPYAALEPPDPTLFDAHGLALRAGDAGVHELYLVNHGGREAIEVFEVDASQDKPEVAWIGAVAQDDTVWGNAVAPVPGGGLVATNYLDLTDPNAFEKVYAAQITGNLKEWHPDTGWTDVPESHFSTPNGVEVSPDGKWFFVGSWATKSIVRLSRGAETIRRDTVPVGFLADNVKWSERGTVLCAGQDSEPRTVFEGFGSQETCNFGVVAVELDPDTLAVRELVRVDDEHFGTASTALWVDDELWIASPRNDMVAYVGRD